MEVTTRTEVPQREDLTRHEAWRVRLIAEGLAAVEDFLASYPAADRKRLKALVQKAQAMKHKYGTPRFLLRYIRELDQAQRSSPS
ncbi:DUF615 domain-containing protein [Pseudoxanthomonas sp. LjRoot143]|uniref:dual-action ribosomal maturation protein DarP n=1 Tax=Pseudoxanthomonas sp. LjRoot143 TaxID=3342266 RepID=UPI003ECFCCB7